MTINNNVSKFFKKSLLSITVASAMLISATAAQAESIQDSSFFNDSTLDLKLRNEFRRADRPSASAPFGPEIDAWVQGYLFDFSSGKINDKVSFDASVYHIQKLAADDNKSSRFYLDGQDSYTLGGVNVNLDLADWAQFKIGQFGTDWMYGSLEHFVPLIDNSSNRTEPTMAEGLLWRGDFANNIHLYGMATTKEAGRYKKKWTDTGLQGIVDGNMVTIKANTIYNLAALWQTDTSNLKLGWQGMKDHANQFQFEAGHTWEMPFNTTMRAESRFYYAKTQGLSKDISLNATPGKDDTYVASGAAWWMIDKWTLTAALGKAGNKLNALLEIDTDVGYVIDQSIDRNGQDMLSWQVGSLYNLTSDLTVGGLVTVTDGYEDHTKTVKQEGLGGTLLLMHKAKEGEMKGLKTTIVYSLAKENRVGSAKGDKLKYYDVMVKLDYPINLF